MIHAIADSKVNRGFEAVHHTEIKICGLKTKEAISAVINGGAEHAGFIFFEKSPRNISPEKARELSLFAGDSISKVAVTVNAGNDFLEQIIFTLQPDLLQLHGSETPERVSEVKQKFKLPVIKALAVRTSQDIADASAYDGIADRLLFDAKAPTDSGIPGGNGISFDWTLLQDYSSTTPYMLSGGLDASNITEALDTTGADAIDISSGVESVPGIKDIEKIAAFINTVRDHDETAGRGNQTKAQRG